MTAYILRRLWQMVPTLAGVILLVFLLFKFFGGDPAQILAGQVASQEQIDAIRRELGLDRPWYTQLGIFVREILSFDFGKSWMTREQVSAIFLTRLPATLTIPLAALVGLAPQTRLYRSFFLDETKNDYVRTARAKGLSEPAILRKHVLRNALVPVVTNVSLLVPGVFVGSFLLEIFFSIPGLGREIYLAVNRSDYPVIQAVTIYLSVLTMLINLAADVLYTFVDPRIQLR